MVCIQGNRRLGATPGFLLGTAPANGVCASDFHDLDGPGDPGPYGRQTSPCLEGISRTAPPSFALPPAVWTCASLFRLIWSFPMDETGHG